MTSARWEARRRDEWLRTARWKVPHGAKHEDGISDRLVLFCLGGFPHVTHDLGAAKAARLHADDVAAVESFREEHPAMAAQVGDLLQVWLEDLAVLAAACRIRDGAGVVRRLLADRETYGERLLVPGAAAVTDPEVLRRLDAIERGQAALTAAIERLCREPLSQRDRAALRGVLPPVVGAKGSASFALWEIFEDDGPALRIALAGWTPQKLGILFAKASGRAVDGYVVVRDGWADGAARWAVREVVGDSGDSVPLVLPGQSEPEAAT